jgi:hypothetical protein
VGFDREERVKDLVWECGSFSEFKVTTDPSKKKYACVCVL